MFLALQCPFVKQDEKFEAGIYSIPFIIYSSIVMIFSFVEKYRPSCLFAFLHHSSKPLCCFVC